MIALAGAGFANTFCSINEHMSFKQAVRNTRLWHSNAEEDEGEYRFKNSYSCVVEYLKRGLNILINTPVETIDNSIGYYDESTTPTHTPTHTPISHTITTPTTAHTTTHLGGSTSTGTGAGTHVRTRVSRSDRSPTPSVTDSDGERELTKITTKNGSVYYARSVVVTASPKVLLSDLIKFNPPLPQDKMVGLKSIDMHRAMKVILKFKARPWPKHLQGNGRNYSDLLYIVVL